MIARAYKLLILDYGGVYSFPYTATNFNAIIQKTFGRLPDDAERSRIIDASHLLGAGGVATQAYVEMVGDVLKPDHLPTVAQFEDATIEVTNPPTPEMVELVRDVRTAGIKVSLLSDMYTFEIERTRPWGRYDGFDYTSFSAEAGMTKWDPRLFESTLQHFNVEPADALFVDDGEKNVAVAKGVGIDTILADKLVYSDAARLAVAIRQRLGL